MENSTSISSQIALGFDLSTQSLKVTALNSSNQIIFKSHINYDADLPHYKTSMGVHTKANNTVTSPVLMWLEAIDLLLSRMKAENFPFDKVVAISGSGQQHGSVYWTSQGQEILQKLDQNSSLFEQFKEKKSFSVEDSPIWMDNSTTEYCLKLEKHLNGAINLAHMTGSRAYERFTGNQIAKIADQTPEIYKETVHISLVSSFFAEIFLGKFSHIDFSDGCGMNLLDLETGNWNSEICKWIPADLEAKLDKPVPSHTVLGKVSDYFVKKYGFNEDCAIVACSGDNPNSLVGLGMFDTSDVGISLGTSDTIFGLVPEKESNKNLEGHIFISPVDPKLHFIMICTKNGSSVREKVKREYAENSWENFDGLLKETSPGNNGKLCLMYEYPEIVPYVEGANVQFLFDNEGNSVENFTNLELIRGVIEGKIVALKYHAEKKGLIPKADGRILITGGGSKNKEILQIIANVFQKEVNVMQIEDSASLGAAIRAWHGLKSEKEGKLLEFRTSFKEFLEERDKNLTVIKPDCELKEVYEKLEKLYEKVLPSISRNIENEI